MILRVGPHQLPVHLGHGLLDPETSTLEIDPPDPQRLELTESEPTEREDIGLMHE